MLFLAKVRLCSTMSKGKTIKDIGKTILVSAAIATESLTSLYLELLQHIAMQDVRNLGGRGVLTDKL